ncbi:response regulator [Daejeonella sp.]|uniref:response regulator n=1 Tax=Daejeonella sp. TaxID=2805397 RepID=UPI0030BDF0E5
MSLRAQRGKRLSTGAVIASLPAVGRRSAARHNASVVVTSILEGEGYKVIQSRTEFGMVEKAIQEKPDAIILDVIRTTPEGTALCNAIKETKSIMHIPVIVFSTHPNIKAAKMDCADEIVSKPFDVFEMIKLVENSIFPDDQAHLSS